MTFSLALLVGLVLLALAVSRAESRAAPREPATWEVVERAFLEFGFQRRLNPPGETGVGRFEAFGADVAVRLNRWSAAEHGGPRAEFIVEPPPGGLAFDVSPRTRLSALTLAPPRWYPVTVDGGDFDRAFDVRCQHVQGGALLSRSARDALERLIADWKATVGGTILVRVDFDDHDDSRLRGVLGDLVPVLRALALTSDEFPTALARRARAEADAEAGEISLRMLVSHYPRHPETTRAFDQALEGDNAVTGLVAAKIHGGARALAALTRWSAAPQPASCRREIIQELARNHSEAEWTEVLARGLHDPSNDVACVAARFAGERRETGLLGALRELVATHPTPRVVQQAIGALRSIGAAGSEQTLVEALDSPHREVRIDAAAALGHLGTLGAVAPLVRLAERLGSLGAVRQAARQAVSEIQARAGDAARGEVALVDAREFEGALATPASSGALSVSSASGLRDERRPVALRHGAGPAHAQGADARAAGSEVDVKSEPRSRA